MVDTDTMKTVGWKLLIGIVPLTGWSNDFKYIFRKGRYDDL